MQIDRVRHDGRADNADRKQQRLGVGELRHDGMEAAETQSTGAMNISTR